MGGVASQERSPRDVREPGDSSAEVWVWCVLRGVLGMFASLGTAVLRVGGGVASQERSPRDVCQPGDSSAEC